MAARFPVVSPWNLVAILAFHQFASVNALSLTDFYVIYPLKVDSSPRDEAQCKGYCKKKGTSSTSSMEVNLASD